MESEEKWDTIIEWLRQIMEIKEQDERELEKVNKVDKKRMHNLLK